MAGFSEHPAGISDHHKYKGGEILGQIIEIFSEFGSEGDKGSLDSTRPERLKEQLEAYLEKNPGLKIVALTIVTEHDYRYDQLLVVFEED